MSKDAEIRFVQVKMGLTPGWGGGARLVELLGKQKTLKLLGKGEKVDLPYGRQLGLVDGELPLGQVGYIIMHCLKKYVSIIKCTINQSIFIVHLQNLYLLQTFQPSRFGRETHGLGCQFTALPLNLMVNQKALKLPNNSGRYYLTHIFDVSRFEVLISRFIWAFFQNLQIWM